MRKKQGDEKEADPARSTGRRNNSRTAHINDDSRQEFRNEEVAGPLLRVHRVLEDAADKLARRDPERLRHAVAQRGEQRVAVAVLRPAARVVERPGGVLRQQAQRGFQLLLDLLTEVPAAFLRQLRPLAAGEDALGEAVLLRRGTHGRHCEGDDWEFRGAEVVPAGVPMASAWVASYAGQCYSKKEGMWGGAHAHWSLRKTLSSASPCFCGGSGRLRGIGKGAGVSLPDGGKGCVCLPKEKLLCCAACRT